jgi:hypothetical protein
LEILQAPPFKSPVISVQEPRYSHVAFVLTLPDEIALPALKIDFKSCGTANLEAISKENVMQNRARITKISLPLADQAPAIAQDNPIVLHVIDKELLEENFQEKKEQKPLTAQKSALMRMGCCHFEDRAAVCRLLHAINVFDLITGTPQKTLEIVNKLGDRGNTAFGQFLDALGAFANHTLISKESMVALLNQANQSFCDQAGPSLCLVQDLFNSSGSDGQALSAGLDALVARFPDNQIHCVPSEIDWSGFDTITDVMLRFLGWGGTTSSLTLDSCKRNMFSPAGLASVVQHCPLQKLSLYNCSISTPQVEVIASPTLTNFVLTHADVGSAALVKLVNNCPLLARVDFSCLNESVDDAVIDAFATSCPHLEFLNVQDSGPLTIASFERLFGRLPAFAFIWSASSIRE